LILLLLLKVSIDVQTRTHSNENLPLFLQQLELRKQSSKEGFDPFYFAFKRIRNHLVEQSESDLRILMRMSDQEILLFLDWWERKYLLRPSDLEDLYSENFVLEQVNPGKYWRVASRRLRDQLRLGWFRKYHHYVLPEYKLFLKDTGYRSTTIHRP
jgi:hypothetical protein